MPTLVLIVFINLLGFGILLPLIPFYAVKLELSIPAVTFVTMGVYSLAQFVASPFVGRLSDRYGRKPILVATMFGTALSYLILMSADSVELLVFSRILGGLNAGNLATAFAYVADVTTEENRAKGMGLLGAAFGMGFVVGPALGGFLAGETIENANYMAPAFSAAALSSLAALGAIFLLKESLSDDIRREIQETAKTSIAQRLRIAFGTQTIGLLVLTGFFYMVAFTMFETIYPLWGAAELQFGPQKIGLTLLYIGIINVIVQGGAIGPLTARLGEHRIVLISLLLVGIGYVTMVNAHNLTYAMVSLTFLAMGGSLFNPSMSSLVSRSANASEQGAILGIYQGAGSLARVIGPIISGFIANAMGFGGPYIIGAILMIPTLGMVLRIFQQYRQKIAAADRGPSTVQ